MWKVYIPLEFQWLDDSEVTNDGSEGLQHDPSQDDIDDHGDDSSKEHSSLQENDEDTKDGATLNIAEDEEEEAEM